MAQAPLCRVSLRRAGEIASQFASVDDSAAMVEKLGGKICMPKTAVPQMGYFVICQDPENNTFALWEMNESAK